MEQLQGPGMNMSKVYNPEAPYSQTSAGDVNRIDYECQSFPLHEPFTPANPGPPTNYGVPLP